jgi:heme-degrading monooxygenase HmoA
VTSSRERTVLRTWSARATPSNADRYVEFFERSLARELRAIAGFRGARVSTRQEPDASGAVVIDVVTEWASMEAIRRFAGATPERAVVEPEARTLLLSWDERVAHHGLRLRVAGGPAQ